MHVADEVQQEFEGDEAFVGRGGGIGEFGGELVDLVDDAVCAAGRGRRGCRAEVGGGRSRRRRARAAQFDVDEVPLPGAAPGAIGVGVAEMVGPGRLGGDVVLGERVLVEGEHRLDRRGGSGRSRAWATRAMISWPSSPQARGGRRHGGQSSERAGDEDAGHEGRGRRRASLDEGVGVRAPCRWSSPGRGRRGTRCCRPAA